MNNRSKLNDWCQANDCKPPTYCVTEERDELFTTQCLVVNRQAGAVVASGVGSGASKKASQEEAAGEALAVIHKPSRVEQIRQMYYERERETNVFDDKAVEATLDALEVAAKQGRASAWIVFPEKLSDPQRVQFISYLLRKHPELSVAAGLSVSFDPSVLSDARSYVSSRDWLISKNFTV